MYMYIKFVYTLPSTNLNLPEFSDHAILGIPPWLHLFFFKPAVLVFSSTPSQEVVEGLNPEPVLEGASRKGIIGTGIEVL